VELSAGEVSRPHRRVRGQRRDRPPRPSRRSFRPEYKLAVVTEYENAPNGGKGAILRRENLFSSHVVEWARAPMRGRWKGWLIPGGRETVEVVGGGLYRAKTHHPCKPVFRCIAAIMT
jgi:hypothetical protein